MIEVFLTCPYCWQSITLLIDGGIDRFEGVEDCEVCCRPIAIVAIVKDGEVVDFQAQKI